MSELRAPTFDDLLAHARWVQGLARHLAADESRADDLVQETWLAALQHPPKRGDTPRGWLSAVVRNFARMNARTASAREGREVAAGRLEALVPASELVERAELQRRLVGVVLELDEPYRAVVLRRYFLDISAEDIARAQAVPASTVRNQLRRALALLRERLEREDGSTWRDRCLLLALWDVPASIAPVASSNVSATASTAARAARPATRALAPSTASSGGAFAAAGALMLSKWLLVPVALALALAAWFLVDGREDASHVAGGPSITPGAVLNEAHSGPDEIGVPGSIGAERKAITGQASASAPVTERLVLAIERAPARLRGLVLDADRGSPIPGVAVRARAEVGPHAPDFDLVDDRSGRESTATTDAHGAFTIAGLLQGTYRVEAQASDGRFASTWSSAAGNETFTLLRLVRPSLSTVPRADLWARVFDQARRPVANAEVRLIARGPEGALGGEGGLLARTDEEGFALFAGPVPHRAMLLAHDEAGRLARADLWRNDVLVSRLEWFPREGGDRPAIPLVLDVSGTIEGLVEGATGAIRVHAFARSTQVTSYRAVRIDQATLCDASGAFCFDGLSPGYFAITVETPPGLRLDSAPGPSRAGFDRVEYTGIGLSLKAGETQRLVLRLIAGPVLEGVVRGANGSAIAGARVRALLPQGLISDELRVQRGGVPLWRLDDDPAPFEDQHPFTARETRTDAGGRYRIDGLPPGPDWQVEVLCPGLSFDRKIGLALEDGKTVALEHVLVPAGGIQGVAHGWASLGVRREGDETFVASWLVPGTTVGPFTVLGLAPGRYEIAALHSDRQVAPTSLANVEVAAGQLTFIDLTDRSPVRAEGRLLYRGQPVPGAVLDFFSGVARTDERGRFLVRSDFDWPGTVRLGLSAPSIADAVCLDYHLPSLFSTAGERSRTIQLPEGEIDVLVRDVDGRPSAAEVSLVQVLDPDEQEFGGLGPSTEAPPEGKVQVHQAKAGALDDGHVRFALLPPGRYRVIAHLSSGSLASSGEIEVSERVPASIELQGLRTGSLAVRVVDERDQPLEGALVRLERLTEESQETFLAERRTGTGGSLEFAVVPQGSVRATYVRGQFSWSPRPFADGSVQAGERVELRIVVPGAR